MRPEELPLLSFEALTMVRDVLGAASTPQTFLHEVDGILADPAYTVAGSVGSWPELVKGEDDGDNAVALWRHTTNGHTGFSRSQATDGRFWTWMALSRYRKYMSARWPLEGSGVKNWKGRVEDRWLMPADPSHRPAVRHGIARLWWVPCLTSDDEQGDMALTRWVLSKERRVIDLLDRYVTMSEPTRYAVLGFVKNGQEMDEDRTRAFMVELNSVAGVLDTDSMSEHDRIALLRDLAQRV